MGLHYQIAGKYAADAHLIGSNTAKVGVELFSNGVPVEEAVDFKKPQRDTNLPYWVIVDSKGTLQGMLHLCRRFEYSKDVIVLVSEQTSQSYLNYLKERNYDYVITGKSHVDLPAALEILNEKYDIRTVLTDTGRVLADLLLNEGLVSELSLLIHPIVVGKDAYSLFTDLTRKVNISLKQQRAFGDGCVWLIYSVNAP
jgi:2,5-diamino-6-(ribosylamino)-4(3H)-pyrimidinone 5'-phosphate reductase